MWFLSSLVLMKTYGGVFYSVLTLPVYKDPIETLVDLERVVLNGEYDVFTYPQSSITNSSQMPSVVTHIIQWVGL